MIPVLPGPVYADTSAVFVTDNGFVTLLVVAVKEIVLLTLFFDPKKFGVVDSLIRGTFTLLPSGSVSATVTS